MTEEETSGLISGDIVVCTNTDNNVDLTLGREYFVRNEDYPYVRVRDDGNDVLSYPARCFTVLSTSNESYEIF